MSWLVAYLYKVLANLFLEFNYQHHCFLFLYISLRCGGGNSILHYVVDNNYWNHCSFGNTWWWCNNTSR